MEAPVLAVVLVAAAMHASWNALLKAADDRLATLALINLTHGIAALPLLALFGLPAADSWPYLAASIVIHFAYFIGLSLSYRWGDLGQVYPLARGTGPLLVAGLAWLLAGERPVPLALAGLLLVSTALLALAFAAPGGLRANRQAVAWALFTALTIAAYTVADGLGGRAAGDVRAYIVALFAIGGWSTFAGALAIGRGSRLLRRAMPRWRRAVVAGLLSFGAYGLVIWAMSIAPLAHVAAVRETSVVFASLIGARLLAEPFGAARVFAAVLVAGGIVLLQAGGG